MLHAGVSGLNSALTAFGTDSVIGRGLRDMLAKLNLTPSDREALLAEAILHHLMEGATLDDAALDATIHDERLKARIRKCRHDCALFADKQQYYDDFRPSYPAAAVAFIRERTVSGTIVADIGSGTGKLAVLLADSAARLYAVEPSAHMRRILAARTADFPSVQVVSATAEATGLPDHSADVITVAEAYHWFDNECTHAEFRRILKPGGHVFLLWNRFCRNEYDAEMQAIQKTYRTYPRIKSPTADERADALFGSGNWERFVFDNTMHQTFQQFYGGMSSASYAPEAGTAAGKAFREAVQALFDQYARHGRITTHVETVVYAGRLT